MSILGLGNDIISIIMVKLLSPGEYTGIWLFAGANTGIWNLESGYSPGRILESGYSPG